MLRMAVLVAACLAAGNLSAQTFACQTPPCGYTVLWDASPTTPLDGYLVMLDGTAQPLVTATQTNVQAGIGSHTVTVNAMAGGIASMPLTGMFTVVAGQPPPVMITLPATLQAEDQTVGGGSTVDSDHLGFRGSGFVNFAVMGGFLEIANLPLTASASISIRYALGATARTGLLLINGASQSITFPPTASWDDWHDLVIPIGLPLASNVVRLQSTTLDLANVDEVTIAAGSVPTPGLVLTCPPSFGSGQAPYTLSYQTPPASGGAAPVSVACTPPSGTIIQASGVVACTATDSIHQTATCTGAVTVTPAPPVTTLPPTPVTMPVKDCTLNIGPAAVSPDGTTGWKWQAQRSLNGGPWLNQGSSDTSAPYGPRSVTLTPGSYALQAIWTKPGQQTIIQDLDMKVCGP